MGQYYSQHWKVYRFFRTGTVCRFDERAAVRTSLVAGFVAHLGDIGVSERMQTCVRRAARLARCMVAQDSMALQACIEPAIARYCTLSMKEKT